MILARIILGFLTVAPMTGYDLMRTFASSAAYFWSADKAQIYRTLARLVDDGLARTEVVTGTDAPDRIVHHITDEGRGVLMEWLSSDPDRQPERDAFLARLFFAGELELTPLRALIASRRDQAHDALGELQAIRRETPRFDAEQERGTWLRSMTLDHGIRAHETHIAWLDELLAGLPDTPASRESTEGS